MRADREARVLRSVRLGRWVLWAAVVPDGPRFAVGRIATTDTPRRDPAPEKRWATDAQGRVLMLCGVGFAVLRCRSVHLRARPD
ncbi:hypothetical protein [Streptomyces rubiginosohelvolus]|uniref:hypothetical protein n=1 Tax=Streptomyces rubiginosohelvolus TaxID=67362 RepID=UPI0035D97BE3